MFFIIRQRQPRRHFLGMAILLGLTILGLSACSDSTEPTTTGSNLSGTIIEGSVDPGAGTFVLKTLEVPTEDGTWVPVQLIGSELVSHPEMGTVDIMVALHNPHNGPLYAPAFVYLMGFIPQAVTVLNADVELPLPGGGGQPGGEAAYGFDYSLLLGEDGVLSAGETSTAKLWRFYNPDMAAFGFDAQAEFALDPSVARIAGYCWHDNNQNGIPEDDEPPLPHGVVVVHGPDGDITENFVGPNGQWMSHVFEPGLYEVLYDPMIDTFAPIAFSTPNPLQVVITADEDDHLQNFLEANFGMYTDLPPGPPAVQFTDLPPDSLHYELWDLQGVAIIDDHFLLLEVGYSGCQPEHPFSLWMSGGFMESMPVQVNLVPVHELSEDCDAYFTAEKIFNLWPLRDNFLDAYGPGVLLLNVIDFNGEVTQVEWAIYPED